MVEIAEKAKEEAEEKVKRDLIEKQEREADE